MSVTFTEDKNHVQKSAQKWVCVWALLSLGAAHTCVFVVPFTHWEMWIVNKTVATNKIESDVKLLKILVVELSARLKALEEGRILCIDASYDVLRPSEIVCLQYVAMGLTNKQIAKKINRRPSTVASTLHKASKRLGVRSRAGALAECYRRGLLVRVADIEREAKDEDGTTAPSEGSFRKAS